MQRNYKRKEKEKKKKVTFGPFSPGWYCQPGLDIHIQSQFGCPGLKGGPSVLESQFRLGNRD
jgi:hypothetical protein